MKAKWMVGLMAAAMIWGAMGTVVSTRGADDAGTIDWKKAQELYQRSQRGEKLSAEDQAYLDRAKAERAKGGGRGGQPAATNMSPKASTELVPLTELTEKYKGEEGGLYGGGKNDIPAEQLKRAQAAAGRIQPLDAAGKPAAEGKIVLLSIGMSNTTQEFSRFKQDADQDAQKNPKLVIADGAQGGMDAAAWVNGRANIKAEDVWKQADQRIEQAGGSVQQVQVVWIKQALITPSQIGEFPKSSDALRDDVVKILNRAKERYPNLQVAYLSSRIYAGYASTMLNPEPYAYEGAFAVRGVIEEQMKGDPALNAEAEKGAVKAPVVLWGPYLWTNGVKGRKGDEVVWKREDVGPDGTHPSESGREKVAQMLLTFFKTEETAKGWFLKSGQ